MPAGNSCGHFLTATLQQFLIVLPVDDITAAVGRLPLVTIFPLRREEILHDGSDHAAMSDDRKMKTERADAPSVLVYLPDPLEFILSMQPSDGFGYHFSPTGKKIKNDKSQKNLSFLCLFDTIDITHDECPSYGFDLHFHSFGSGFESIHKEKTTSPERNLSFFVLV